MKHPKVSIITVVKDDLELLERTIQSVSALKYDNLEYIVIHGRKHSDAQNRIIDMGAGRIDVLVSEPDQGVYDAMNKGLKLCHGDWVHFLNAGDVYLDDHALDHLLPYFDSKFDLIFADVMREKVSGERELWKQRKPMRFGLFRNICHQGVWYNKIKNPCLKYDLSFRISADCHLLLELLSHKDFCCHYVKAALTSFKLGGLSQSHADIALHERRISFKTFLKNPFIYALNSLNLSRQIKKLSRQTK